MGAVFEAVQEPIGRRVAVKILHAKYAQEPQITARFFNEARAVNLVDHPGIVQVSDYGQLPDGTAYLVMEFLKGETLNQRQKQKGMLPLPEVLRLARQIASALAAAHEKGVYHRDLKPDNVMLVPDVDSEVPGRERAKLLDFGIAKVSAQQESQAAGNGPRTSTDVVMGTPRYMAPEQCRGGIQIDDKADVYSLGIMLFEMLAGRAPFVGGSGEVLAMHIYEQPPQLRDLAPHVPEPLAQLIHRLIAKKKEERPTMREVVQLLEQLSVSHPTAVLQAISLPMLQGLMATPPGSNPALTPAAGLSGAHPSTLGLSTGQAQSDGRKRRLAALAAVSAGGLLIGTLVVVALRLPTVTPPPPPPPTSPPGEKPESKVKQVHWSLNSIPQGALVIRAADGEVLGTTPWAADRPAGDGMLDVKLRRSGYAERTIRLNLGGDETREETLDAAAVKPKLPPRTTPVRPPGRGTGTRPSGGNQKSNDNDGPRIVD